MNEMAFMEHNERVEQAIDFALDLAKEDIDVFDKEVFHYILKRHNLLNDGFEDESSYIKSEVLKKLCY